ncbi:MAG: hypothetical protein ACK42L_05485 [Thermoanaerobaculum sp.]
MRREHLLGFVRREREAVEQARVAYWREVARSGGAAVLLAIADGLRRHVQAHCPAWPDIAEREADLACHVRVSRALSRVRTSNPI